MALQETLKSFSLNVFFINVGVDGRLNIFVQIESQCVFHIDYDSGIATRIVAGSSDLTYVFIEYSITENLYYLRIQESGELIEFNPVNKQVKVYNYNDTAYRPNRGNVLSVPTLYAAHPYVNGVSTDGNIWMGLESNNGSFGALLFNPVTKTVEKSNVLVDRELEHIHGIPQLDYYKIDTGAFSGVYTSYQFGSSLEDINPTIISEIGSSGLTWTNHHPIFLHWDDREVGSLTRRIFTPIGSSEKWRFIDLKSPSTYLESSAAKIYNSGFAFLQNFVDQSAVPVSKTGWSSGLNLSDVAGDVGITVPTYMVVQYLPRIRKIGRFVYNSFGSYLSNKSYTPNFALHPTTLEAIYPNSFDKYTTYLDNSYKIHKCNFGGLYGFSSDNELVVFVTDTGGNWGFYRPDNNTWTAYDQAGDPGGYIVRRDVNLDDPDDPDGLGIVHEGRFGNTSVAEYFGEDWNVPRGIWAKGTSASVAVDPVNTEIDPERPIGSVTLKVTDNILAGTLEYKNIKLNNARTGLGEVCHALEARADKFVIAGQMYSGISLINYVDPDTWTFQGYKSSRLSFDGAIIFDSGNKVFCHGYLGANQIIDITDWDNIQSTTIGVGDGNEPVYAALRSDCILTTGVKIREQGYKNGLLIDRYNLSAPYTVTKITDVMPNELNTKAVISLRTAAGMTDAEYSDAVVETKIQAYMITSGQSRADVIAEFLDTCRWDTEGLITYGNRIVLGLTHRGPLALSGIRIEQTVGSGVWINQDYYDATTYPKVGYINIADITTLTPSDVKLVEFQVAGLLVSSVGRVLQTENYLCFVINNIGLLQSTIKCVSKSNFEAAATSGTPITTWDKEITIPYFGTGNNGLGGDSEDNATHQIYGYDYYGDVLYAGSKGGNGGSGNYPIVYAVDIVAESYSQFATRSTQSDGTNVSINATTKKMLIGSGTNVYVIEDFDIVSTPVVLT